MKLMQRIKRGLYTIHISFRITQYEYEILDRMRKKLHKNQSEVIRQAINELYRRIRDKENE